MKIKNVKEMIEFSEFPFVKVCKFGTIYSNKEIEDYNFGKMESNIEDFKELHYQKVLELVFVRIIMIGSQN